jgi:hypothetical protein
MTKEGHWFPEYENLGSKGHVLDGFEEQSYKLPHKVQLFGVLIGFKVLLNLLYYNNG